MNRATAVARLTEVERARDAWIHYQVVTNGRVDILAKEVLGYTVADHHAAILGHQINCKQGLILLPRGAGKTLMATVTMCIFELLRDPNVRVLIASKSAQNARDMMALIKNHLLHNERFIEVFGQIVDAKRTGFDCIWLHGRTRWTKEPNVSYVGIESAIASKHYDIIICDDLIDPEYARTKRQRKNVLDFYYNVLSPVLDPTPEHEKMWIIGTRYHYEDLYGYLAQNDMAGAVLRIPAIIELEDGTEKSYWEEKWPLWKLQKRRKMMPKINFDLQFQCTAESMKGGGLIEYDQCQLIDVIDIPEDLPCYVGVDVAVEEGKRNDFFAIVGIRYDRLSGNIYVIYCERARLNTLSKQKARVQVVIDELDPLKCAIESVAYQAIFANEMLAEHDERRSAGESLDGKPSPIVKVKPRKDKFTRLQLLTPYFENNQVFFVSGLDGLIDELVRFPDAENDDRADSFVMACLVATEKIRKERRNEDFGIFQ